MAKVSFNVDAYTARLIGRENVAKLNGAILELVKNTYDADATVCFIYYDDNNGILYIGDNGCGMSSPIIKKHWMTIGNSSKKRTYVTKSGRIQTGAKGIGRFALDRIADKCTMMTQTKKENLLWTVDWRDFDQEGTITEVDAELDEVNLTFTEFVQEASNVSVVSFVENYFSSSHGTIFKLNLLRDKWNKKRIEELKNDLAMLIPFEISQEFNIYIFDNETIKFDDAVVLHDNDSFSFDYKIQFDIAQSGEAKISIFRNEFDFRDKFDFVMKNTSFTQDDQNYFLGEPIKYSTTYSELITKKADQVPNSIGQFSGTLYFAKLSYTAADKDKYYYKDISGRKDFQDAFGGIKIYRDNFRVRPYGEANTSNFDWLQLSGRKNRSPAAVSHPTGKWRVRGDQMLGSIFISRINIALPDQANREGIVETPEFSYLKTLILNIIEYFERDRQYVFRILNDLHDRNSQAEIFKNEIKRKAEKADDKSNQSGNISESQKFLVEATKAQVVIDEKDAIIRILEDENRLLRALATTGITTNTYIHEFKELTHRLNMKIVMAHEALEYDRDMDDALVQISAADQIRDSFTSWFRVTIESVRNDKRKHKKISINEFLRNTTNAWQQIIDDKGIKIIPDIPEEITYFRCFPYEMDTIFSNLITNSVSVLNSKECIDKQIIIALKADESKICIDYSDTGPGLSTAYKKDPYIILEAFETDKANDSGEIIGTGMGMWIINKTVSEYNGSIDLSKNRIEESGFYFHIELPRNC